MENITLQDLIKNLYEAKRLDEIHRGDANNRRYIYRNHDLRYNYSMAADLVRNYFV